MTERPRISEEAELLIDAVLRAKPTVSANLGHLLDFSATTDAILALHSYIERLERIARTKPAISGSGKDRE
jgi:hypothetical protein